MAKVQRSDSGRMPPRSENFQRMLELEKQYKPSSAARSRRGSGYPPLSHQDQIMKAMSRSSNLPSLSISIPPSPPQDLPPKTSDPREQPQLTQEERTKTVTFSDPEEDHSSLSDQSSICHSPSWEGWGKKTKKPNKPEPKEEQNNEEKSGKTPRKKGNRLSKAPPQEPLTSSAVPSQSTLQLDPLPKIERATGNAPRLEKQDTMAQPQVQQKQAPSQVDSKSKSKRFLSGFKLQHGNVTGVKKLVDNAPGQTESNQPGHDRSSSTPSINKSHSAGPVFDLGFLGSRRSSADPSVRSHSSAEKRPPMVRPPSSGSSHTRSQSLLSSTLNKLRGPSYLYHRSQEGKSSKSSFRPASRDDEGSQPPGNSAARPGSSEGTTPVIADTTFTRKSRHRLTTSDNDVSLDPPFATQPLAPRDLNRGYNSPAPPRIPGRNSHKSSPQVSDGESTIRDSQEDIQWVSESQGSLHGQGHPTGRNLDSRNGKAQVEKTEPGRLHKTNGQISNRVPTPAESLDGVERDSVASSQDDDYASAHEHQSDHASTMALRRGDVSRAAAGNSVPKIRPSSQEKDIDPFTTQGHSEPSLMPPKSHNISQALKSDPDANPKTAQNGWSSKREKPELENEGSQGALRIPKQQLRTKHSTDYFTFINESYAPPSLELRSPLENLLQSLNKTKRLEEAELADEPRPRSSGRQPVSKIPIYAETQPAMYKGKTGDKSENGHRQRDSPVMPTQVSERDAPSFERLGTSAKATKPHRGSDAESTSTKQSQQHEASHSTSERSSSSTFGDSPPSPSSMTTPESSRPYSHKSRPPSHLDLNGSGVLPSNSGSEGKPRQRVFPLSSRDRSSSRSRPTSREANAQDDNWSRSALPLDLENYSSISLSGADVLASSPALVSTPASMTFADALKEEIAEDLSNKSNYRDSLQPKAHSALDLPSTSFLPPLKHRSLNPKKNTSKLSVTVVSAPSSPLSEPVEEPLKPALKKSRNNVGGSSQEPQALVSSGAAYLQEARKTVSGAPIPAPRTLRPQFAHRNTTIGAKGATTPGRAEPMAKMLVECCSCHFFHDMPARVYECMAKPDSFVEDKTLGVSAAITTMVKCPWCGHGMTTQCCSGYAAVVYLKEKLHGR
ncbi:hypothetical protein SLS62_010727 [Diatrype stigma]|uniref:Uncharacterized protein n=1 Tax=Diatrype stigma TaxID=117547 RepID=A0AAN9YHP8_9PEZI